MRKFTLLGLGLAVLWAMVSFTGCAMVLHAPTTGFIYTDASAPVAVGDQSVSATKVGEASASSILGWISTGDASLEAAMKAGGITKIHHVDMKASSILGIIATYKIIVYGQ